MYPMQKSSCAVDAATSSARRAGSRVMRYQDGGRWDGVPATEYKAPANRWCGRRRESGMANGKWIKGLKAQTPLAEAARRVLEVRLGVVRTRLLLAVREPDKDPEHVHQLRVGTRRAGAAVEIFEPCLRGKCYRRARKALKKLRRAAAAARDCDVFHDMLTGQLDSAKPT